MPIDMDQIGYNLVRIVIAFVLALPIGWNRERAERSAGLRTFPLVSIASCGYMLAGLSVFTNEESLARVTYGIITGMGFIGGGAILKSASDRAVFGTATAASIWCTGAIGVSVAWSRFEIAVMLSIIAFLILLAKERHPRMDREL